MSKRRTKVGQTARKIDLPADVALLIERAYTTLKLTGVPVGLQRKTISLKLDPSILEAAKRRTGISDHGELVTAALAVLATTDDFGRYLVSRSGTLSADFELAV